MTSLFRTEDVRLVVEMTYFVAAIIFAYQTQSVAMETTIVATEVTNRSVGVS